LSKETVRKRTLQTLPFAFLPTPDPRPLTPLRVRVVSPPVRRICPLASGRRFRRSPSPACRAGRSSPAGLSPCALPTASSLPVSAYAPPRALLPSPDQS